MLSNTFSDFISDMGVTDHRHCMIDSIENKIESLHFQQCSLKNRSLWKLVISPEASFFCCNCSYMQYQYQRDIKEISSILHYRYFVLHHVLYFLYY